MVKTLKKSIYNKKKLIGATLLVRKYGSRRGSESIILNIPKKDFGCYKYSLSDNPFGIS
jgi:hypothetical protein